MAVAGWGSADLRLQRPPYTTSMPVNPGGGGLHPPPIPGTCRYETVAGRVHAIRKGAAACPISGTDQDTRTWPCQRLWLQLWQATRRWWPHRCSLRPSRGWHHWPGQALLRQLWLGAQPCACCWGWWRPLQGLLCRLFVQKTAADSACCMQWHGMCTSVCVWGCHDRHTRVQAPSACCQNTTVQHTAGSWPVRAAAHTACRCMCRCGSNGVHSS